MQFHDDDGPVPERSQEELLAVVRAKAGRIRRRRLEVFCGVTAGVVLLVGSIAVAGMSGDEPTTTVDMASPSVTTAPAVDGPVPGPGVGESALTHDPAAATTTVPPAGANSIPSGGGSTPAPAGGTQPAPAAPAPGTPQDPDPVPNFGPAPEPCAPSDVLVTATTDRPSYPVGAQVPVTLTSRNVSSHPCPLPTSFSLHVVDPSGKGLGMAYHGDYITPPPPLQPGQTHTETMTWPGTVCDDSGCTPASPGQYTATGTVNNHPSAPVTFTISS